MAHVAKGTRLSLERSTWSTACRRASGKVWAEESVAAQGVHPAVSGFHAALNEEMGLSVTDKVRVLIVDDDLEFTRTTSDILVVKGFSPLATTAGREALRLIEMERPAAAIIDLVLEDVSGLEILREMRKLSPETECFVLTSHASEQSAIEAVNLGAHGYWLKPVDPEQLVFAVRKAAEKVLARRTLRESEENYRLFVEHAAHGIVLLDGQGNIVEVNASALEISGLEREQVVGRNLTELLPLLGLPASSRLHKLQRRMLDGASGPLDFTIPKSRNQQITIRAHTSPVRREGRPAGLFVVLEDVTEKEKAQGELQRLRDFHESIVQSTVEGIIVIDADGRITFVNPSAVAMWGYDEDQLIGKHWTEIVPPDQRHVVQAAMKRRQAGRSDSYELQQLRQDGRRFTTLVSGSPRFEDGEFAGAIAVFTDITELKKAQQEIDTLSQFQQSIIDNADVWLDVIDENANVVIWNKAAERISGYSREEVVGHDKIWEWLYPDEEYRRQITACMERGLDHHDDMESIDTTIKRKDGESRIISWQARSLLDQAGNPLGSVALGRDVTEHKQAEDALRESEEKYRNLVERASDGLAILQDLVIKYVNPTWTTMSGYLAEELIDTPYRPYVWPDDLPSVDSHRQRRLEGEEQPITYEAGLVHKDGHRVPVELSAGVIAYNGRPAELVVARDISERKRAQDEIQRRTEEQERRLEQMTALYETSLEIVGQLELPRLLHSILQRAVNLLRTQAGKIWLYHREDQELELVANCGSLGSPLGTRLAPGEGLAGKVFQSGHADVIMDYRAGDTRTDWHYSDSMTAIASAPLKWGDQIVGVITVFETDKPRAWDEHDLRLLTLLANQAAAAIENARLYGETASRARELQALYEASLDLPGRLDFPDLLTAVVSRALELLEADRGGFLLYDESRDDLELAAAVGPDRDRIGARVKMGEGAWGRAAQSSKPLVVTDYLARQGTSHQAHAAKLSSMLSVPLRRGDGLLGVLYLEILDSRRRFRQRDVRLATLFANQAAIAMENARLLATVREHRSDLRELSAQLINAQEEERKRISRELHDELGQTLTAMSIDLAIIKTALPAEPNPLVMERLNETSELVDQTLDQIRDLSLELRPSLLDDLGLVPALRWYVNGYAERGSVDVQLETIGLDDRLSPAMETVLYRVCQEALTNVARHAQASRVHVRLERTEDGITAVIEDNGVGFDAEQPAAPGSPRRGVGLLGIRERVSSQGGSIRVESRPESGTRLIVKIPLAQEP
jgi:PAS domain S-box-containing protein